MALMCIDQLASLELGFFLCMYICEELFVQFRPGFCSFTTNLLHIFLSMMVGYQTKSLAELNKSCSHCQVLCDSISSIRFSSTYSSIELARVLSGIEQTESKHSDQCILRAMCWGPVFENQQLHVMEIKHGDILWQAATIYLPISACQHLPTLGTEMHANCTIGEARPVSASTTARTNASYICDDAKF